MATGRISIGESLQDYAERIDVNVQRAYHTWHQHGDQFAADMSSREAANPQLNIRGRKCLGLTDADVSDIARGSRFESRRLAAY